MRTFNLQNDELYKDDPWEGIMAAINLVVHNKARPDNYCLGMK